MLRKDHPVGADLLQHFPVDMALSLAHHLLDTDLLQIQRNEGVVAHVVSGGHDGTVIIAHPQGTQDVGVPGVAAHRVGHKIHSFLYLLRVGVDGQHLMAQAAQLRSYCAAEAAQADHNKCLHSRDPSFIRS